MKYVTAIFLLLFPFTVLANEALVRSGEHSGFSRLVVYLSEQQTWKLEPTKDGATFSVDDWDRGFNTGSIFSLIPRTRLKDVTAEQNSLKLIFDCPCTIKTEQLSNGPVIIDILDANDAESVLMPATANNVIVPANPVPTEQKPFWLGSADSTHQALQFEIPEPTIADTPEENLDELRRNVAREVARAAGRQFLSIDTDQPSSIDTAMDALETAPSTNLNKSGIEAQTRMQNADQFSDRIATVDVPLSRSRCLPASALDVVDWRAEGEFISVLASIRSRLFGEFDELSEDTVIDLARLYASNGFSAEARSVLAELPSNQSEIPLLQEVTEIFDEGASDGKSLQSMAHCSPRFRLWSILAAGEANLSKDSLRDVILEFSGWPSSMRRDLGPLLVKALKNSGKEVDADVVQKQISNSGRESSSRFGIQDELISRLSREELMQLAMSREVGASEALAALIEQDLSEGRQIEADTILLAEALAFELSDTDTADRLKNLAIRSKIKGRNFSAAFTDIFDRSTSDLASELLITEFLDMLSQHGTNYEVAKSAVDLGNHPPLPEATFAALHSLIERLASMGQIGLIEYLAKSNPESSYTADILALIALAGSDAEKASNLVASEQIEDAMLLRLSALSGDHAEALNRLRKGAHKSTAAWRAMRFSEYERDDERAAVITHLESQTESEESTTLSFATDVLELSASARQDIDRLLNLPRE